MCVCPPQERKRMLAYYMHTLLSERTEATPIKIEDDIDETVVSVVTDRTEGFSGREINKLAVAWQAAAYGQVPPVLNKELMEEVLEIYIDQKQKKVEWAREENETYAHLMNRA